ncbi:hypothetical protein V2J09_015650 [Rumex salicifolius]
MQDIMETRSISCVINSISRFIHLVSCQTSRSMPTMKDFQNMAVLMKHLKPLLDEVVDGKMIPDNFFLKGCQKLDIDINEGRDFMEKWSPKASKILSVWQSELVLNKIRMSSVELCQMLNRLQQSPPSSSSSAELQELQNWQPNRVLSHIEQALRDQTDNATHSENMLQIIESLGLNSNQELLRESVVVERERTKAQDHQTKGQLDQIFRVADLIPLIRDYMLKTGYFDSSFGFSTPSYFRCPLSLSLMLDPVIVASGLTFERASIQEWFDHGLSICPKTSQPLSHTNVLPNHTIKAMISNWFEENNHKFPSHDEIIHEQQNFHGSVDSSSHSTSKSDDDEEVESNVWQSREPSEITTSSPDDTTTSSCVNKLVKDLNSQSIETQTSGAMQIRLLAKNNVQNRDIIGKCGAIKPLISLMHSDSKIAQEHAVTALLNLSINEYNKSMIAEAGAIEPFIHVLESGNDAARENSAAALFSLSVLEEHKVKIGRSAAVKALVNLLESGTVRGKKDAVTALFNLSICHENKARIIQAGAVKHLVKLLERGSPLVDKAVALLANLVTVPEGRLGFAREGGIPLVVEILDCGSRRGKENAASTLLQLCVNSNKFCNMVLQEGAIPPLVALSQSGTPRAQEKAQQLLAHFRNQREASVSGKKKASSRRDS